MNLKKYYILKIVKFWFDTKSLSEDISFLSLLFLLKNTLKIALQYLFNVFVLFKKVFYLKLIFKLKIHQKKCTFKNLEKICQLDLEFE